MKKWGLVVAFTALIALLTSCTAVERPVETVSPTSSSTKASSDMTPEQAKAEAMDLYNAINRTIGGDWEFEGSWNECALPTGEPGAFFNVGSDRIGQPLSQDPDAVAAAVREVMRKRGFDVRVEHDTTLTPPRAVIGYPRGYLRGTEADGFGFQFTVGKDYADFSMSGHCVPGDYYYLNTGKHL